MLVPKSSTIPPGGFHFEEAVSADEKVRIDGTSADDVARNLLLFRLGRNMPPGNPMQDVTNFICGNWPHFCNESEPPIVPPTRTLQAGFASRVAAWMSDLVRIGSRDPVSDNEAERRAAICAQCPQNVGFETGCGACLDTIQRLSFVFRAGRTTPQDNVLKACAISAQHNPSAVGASTLPVLSAEEIARLPANCWRK